jgi:cell division protease FtsH
MNDSNNNETKKGMPGNFVLFLIIAFFAVLVMQNFLDVKTAKVSFSYQLEPLVNLDLIKPEDSRKTAIGDSLVTFSGRFRERLTDEGKKRYKFISLLEENHELAVQSEKLQGELVDQRKRIEESADLFLHLSGIPIPSTGYIVVDDLRSSLDKDKLIVINKLSSKDITSLKDVQNQYESVIQSPDEESVNQLGAALVQLIRNFRSPLLGIGNEKMKVELREIQSRVSEVNNSEKGLQDRLNTYGEALGTLDGIVAQLNQYDNGFRLTQLRPVRNYQQATKKYSQIVVQLQDNQARLDKARNAVANVIWFFNNKELSTRALVRQDSETYQQWFINAKEEWNNFEENKGGFFKAPDQPLNTVLKKKFRSEEPPPAYLSYLFPALLAFGVLAVLYLLFARQMKGVGSGAMNFGKSPAKMIQPKGDQRVTFKDVAGIDEALEELEEIVDFLKNPKKFTTLGGRIPKGVLCIGPPGTGKTLVAKAVAGEADRPFFSISGSDFVEMFVGVGASRIRDLFEQAKKNAPCIIFIDEIDAVGRHRGAGIGGGHDEREQTLNQLLVEMDGFETNEGVIIMAATNRPDVLDKALLRPGRFDRNVTIPLPDIKGRYEILKVHAKKIKMDTSVDLMTLARGTPGCSGADLANMLNEAALIAARKGRTAVTMQEINEARDKVLYGKERRSLEIDESEKRTTAYHEAGHTVVGLVVEHSDPIDKVTIIPRGMSLGSTMFLPEKNRTSYWKKELIDKLAVLMGGRCAEDIFIGDVSSGAKQDIDHATQLARSMVCEWGMSDKLGAVAYDERSEAGAYGMQGHHEKKYSESTAQAIDEEVRHILDEANKTAMRIIKEHRDQLELMAKLLIEYETLDSEDLRIIMEDKWDDTEKRLRLKKQEEMHKKPSVQPPPPPPEEEEEENSPPIQQTNQEGNATA